MTTKNTGTTNTGTTKDGKTAKGREMTNSSGKAYAKTSRCWPGYEPVKGKSEHDEGSCRKLPASRNGGVEPKRETAREKQISLGGKRARQARAAKSGT
jgi:hypothetical protein